MGCDGGTIPTRDELVRLKKKPEKVWCFFDFGRVSLAGVRPVRPAPGTVFIGANLYLGGVN